MPNKKELIETFLGFCESYQDEVHDDGSSLSDKEIAVYSKQDMMEDLTNLDTTKSSVNRWENLLDTMF